MKMDASRRRSLYAAALVLLGIVIAIRVTPSKWQESLSSHRCAIAMKSVVIALQAYHEEYGTFPPPCSRDESGKPLHSWRTLLLPFLHEEELAAQIRYDEPWDSVHNRKFHDLALRHFACPWRLQSEPVTSANYFAVTGCETMWPMRGRGRENVPDGTQNTIIIIESESTGVHWMEPRDIDFNAMSFDVNDYGQQSARGRHSVHRGRWRREVKPFVYVGLVDGRILRLSQDSAPEMFRALLTAAGGEGLEVNVDAGFYCGAKVMPANE